MVNPECAMEAYQTNTLCCGQCSSDGTLLASRMVAACYSVIRSGVTIDIRSLMSEIYLEEAARQWQTARQ